MERARACSVWYSTSSQSTSCSGCGKSRALLFSALAPRVCLTFIPSWQKVRARPKMKIFGPRSLQSYPPVENHCGALKRSFINDSAT